MLWFLFRYFFTPKSVIEEVRKSGNEIQADKMEARRIREISRRPDLYIR
jgi:hypothetical protein